MILLILLLSVPVSLTQDPCTQDNHFASWMGDLYNKTLFNNISQSWSSRRLNEILIGGSHDAGLWSIESKTGLAVFFPDNLFITQSYSLIGQLCNGARWFDIRFSYKNNQWRIFHGTSLISAFNLDIYSLIDQVKQFLSFPRYSLEVVFWRIKIPSGDSANMASILRSQLSGFLVDNVNGNMSLQELTLSQIWSQRNVGSLVLMEYGWSAPSVEPGQNQGWIWDYKNSQLGSFSDAVNLNNMLTRCVNGQFPKLLDYKSQANRTGPGHPLIGIWWTYTTGDIQTNTNQQWSNYPLALNDFYFLNKGEIGNCLLVDFFGDHSEVMRIVWDYNNNKFGSSPPLPPDYGYYLNSVLPGAGMVSGDDTCTEVESATDSFTRNVIIVFSVVVFLIFVLLIGICVGIGCYCKKRKEEKQRRQDVYVQFGK